MAAGDRPVGEDAGAGQGRQPPGTLGEGGEGRRRCAVMEAAPCAPLPCSSARWS